MDRNGLAWVSRKDGNTLLRYNEFDRRGMSRDTLGYLKFIVESSRL